MPEDSKIAEKYKESTEETKFTPEELETIKGIQQEYFDTQSKLGQLSVARIRLDNQASYLDNTENDLRNSWFETQKKEQDFMSEMNKKYGDGTLNASTGEFTKDSK